MAASWDRDVASEGEDQAMVRLLLDPPRPLTPVCSADRACRSTGRWSRVVFDPASSRLILWGRLGWRTDECPLSSRFPSSDLFRA